LQTSSQPVESHLQTSSQPVESHLQTSSQPVESHLQTSSRNVVLRTPRLNWIRTHDVSVIGTDCIGSYKSNHHPITITITTAPFFMWFRVRQRSDLCSLGEPEKRFIHFGQSTSQTQLTPNWELITYTSLVVQIRQTFLQTMN
jgi:hypothetical protein